MSRKANISIPELSLGGVSIPHRSTDKFEIVYIGAISPLFHIILLPVVIVSC